MTRASLVAPEWTQRLAQAGLSDLGVLLASDPETRVAGRWQALAKPGLGGRQRWRWELDGVDGGILYVKRYERMQLREQLDRIRRQALRHSRAWWEYRQAGELARQFVPAVRAIAVVEEMGTVWEARSAVVFERAAGDAFDRVWPQVCVQEAPVTRGAARHELTRQLARLVSAFHQTGLCHRDLYLCHVFVDLDSDARRPPRFTLIDLARTHRPRLRRQRWILKDLSQLDASARQIAATRTDRLRFLVAYLGLEPGAPRVGWYARRIVRKSDRIRRRIARQSGAQ